LFCPCHRHFGQCAAFETQDMSVERKESLRKKEDEQSYLIGAMTISIMTLDIMTLGIITSVTMTLVTMTLVTTSLVTMTLVIK